MVEGVVWMGNGEGELVFVLYEVSGVVGGSGESVADSEPARLGSEG